MASVGSRYTLGDSTDATSYSTGSFTPSAGDLLIVFFGMVGTTSADPAPRPQLTSTAIGFGRAQGTYAPVPTSWLGCYIAGGIIYNPVPMTITCNWDNGATGACWVVCGVQGMQKVGGGIGLGAEANSITSGSLPASTPSFIHAAGNVNNLILSCVQDQANPPAITPPTGFTTLVTVGGATPVQGLQVISKPNGCVANTTWGSSSTGSWEGIWLEVASNNLAAADRPQFMAGSGI